MSSADKTKLDGVEAAAKNGLVSIDGVANAGGNVDLVAVSPVTITPDDGANTVSFGLNTQFAYETVYWVFDGTAAVTTGNKRVPIVTTGTVVKAWATANTAPTGSALTFDINENGTTIMTTKLSIAAAANSGTSTTFSDTTLTENNYLTCDIDSIGSGTPGSNIVVALRYRYAI
jgi:hypothetical protein